MNVDYLEKAKAQVKDVRKLIIGASRRASELANGSLPLVDIEIGGEKDNTYLDVALLEIAEGKVTIEHAPAK